MSDGALDVTPPATYLTLADTSEIVQLAAAYCWYVDTADTDGLISILAPDVVFALGRREIVGREAVIQFLATSVRGTHVAGAPLIRSSTSGVVGFSRFVFVPADGGALMSGGYTDDFVQLERGWVFARRTVSIASASTA